jgi:tRNA 2-thiouridine synthesizing protein C
MYLNRKAPYGTIYAWEALEVVLIGAAFDQDVCVLFLDDGVYQLTRGQDTKGIGMKNFSPTYRTLGDYEVRRIYVDRASLEARGLTQTTWSRSPTRTWRPRKSSTTSSRS